MATLAERMLSEQEVPPAEGTIANRMLGLEEVSPAREKMAEVEPVKEPLEAQERLKTLELSGLPIITPRTTKELMEPALAIPRGVAGAAKDLGLAIPDLMYLGPRMLYEIVSGEPAEVAEKKAWESAYKPSKGWSDIAFMLAGAPPPVTKAEQKVSEYAMKPFELIREGVLWAIPKFIRAELRGQGLSNKQIDALEKNAKIYPYIATALGVPAEAGTYALIGRALKGRAGEAEPTLTQIKESISEATRAKKVEAPPAEAIPPIEELRKAPVRPKAEEDVLLRSREAKELSAALKKILAEEAPAEEVVPSPKPIPEVPPEAAPIYEGLRPGAPEWMRYWREHPEEQSAMAAYARGEALTEAPLPDISPVASSAEALTPEFMERFRAAAKEQRATIAESIRQEELRKLPIAAKAEALEEAFGRKLTAAEETHLAAGGTIEEVIRKSVGIKEEIEAAPPKAPETIAEPRVAKEVPYTKVKTELREVFDKLDEVVPTQAKGALARKKNFRIKEHILAPGERGEVPPTWHDGTFRYTVFRYPDGRLEIGAAGSYDTVLLPGHAAAGGKGALPPGAVAYIVDLGPGDFRLINIYRGSGKIQRPAKLIEKAPETIIEPEVIDAKTKSTIKAMDAEGFDTFKIADRLNLKESEVGEYLEGEWFKEPKKIIKVEEIETEARSLLEEAKDLDEAYEKIRELTTRYEDNVDVRFADEFERHRYREWGDDILSKIIKARRDKGMPDPPAVTLESFGLQHYYEFAREGAEKVAESFRRKFGVTEDPNLSMYIDEAGRRIKMPGTYERTRRLVDVAVHGEVDQLNFGRDVLPGELARRAGWLEIRDNGSIAWVRSYTRLSDKQIDFLRKLSNERARIDVDMNDAEGVPIRDFTKEDLSQFFALARPASKAAAPIHELLDFGGFQKMYEMFANGIRSKAKKPLSARAEDMLNRGEIVKQRKKGTRTYPPIYEAEYHVLKGAKVLDETWFGRALTTMPRVFEEAGGEPLLNLTTHPYHAAEKAFITTWEHAQKSLNRLEKQFSRRERRNIMTHAVSQQDKGPAMLKWMGIKEVPKLSPKEMEGYTQLRQRYESLFKRLNRVRRACGIKEFPKQENYFTFFRSMSLMEELGFRPFDMPLDVFNKQYIKMRATPFKFARRRTRALYRLEMDPFWVIKRYERTALRHIHMSPLIAKVREYLNVIKDPITGEPFDIKVENPVLARALDGWISHIAGQRHPWSMGRRLDAAAMRVSSNLVASTLGANVRSALIQPTALRNTVAEIGFDYTAKGIRSLVDPRARNFALKRSKVLVTRKAGGYDVTAMDALRAIRVGKTAEARAAITKAVLKPLQVLDYEAALATWQGAYEFGIEKLGLTAKRAGIYADDVVVKTQASALPGDIAPIQRPAVGRLFTLFQTFTINDWNFFVRDVLGKRNATINTPKAFAKAMKYVAATTMLNILCEDILHLNSPFPTPIRAYKEAIDRGDEFPSLVWNVSREFLEPIPIIGAYRYGYGPGGPALELANEIAKHATKDPRRKPWWDIFLRGAGMWGTAQISKSIRATKRGESAWGIVAGTYTPPPKARPTRPRTRQRTRR